MISPDNKPHLRGPKLPLLALVAALHTLPVCADTPYSALRRGDNGAAAAQFMARAMHDDAVAQNNLGALYLRGRGVPLDFAKALHWFMRAAEQDLRGAQFNIGIMYLRGYGVAPDAAAAHTWFRRAAAQGDRDAQLQLALLLYQGEGTARDIGAAATLFQQAAEAGSNAAAYNLGVMYLRGEIPDYDSRGALPWLQQAAVGGYRDAQFSVGELLEHTHRDPSDLEQAYAYYLLSQNNGHGAAPERIAALDQRLDAAAQERGRRLADELQARLAASSAIPAVDRHQ